MFNRGMRFITSSWRLSLSLVAIAVLAGAITFFTPTKSSHAAPSFHVIRDVEIERDLHVMLEPIFRNAGLNPSSIKFVIVQDSVMNAFVAGGMNIFLYTTLIQATDNPEQLVGVTAHETGHIAGGHLVQGTGVMKNASMEAILSMVVGTAAAVLSGNPQAGAAVITGGQHIAQRSALAFTRSQEAAADAAGMRFLEASHFTSRGLADFLQKLKDQEGVTTNADAEYSRTHPLTRDRIDTVRNFVDNSPYRDAKMPPEYYEMHERIKAKLLGFLQPDAALLRYGEKDPRVSARYARAIAYYRKGDVDKAITALNGLIATEPNNPFFYELKGQVLFENGQVTDAAIAYKRANELLPDTGLLQAAYGHALLETQNAAYLDAAIDQLNRSLKTEAKEPDTWRLLATAWGRKSNEGMVDYCLAEEAQTRGDRSQARKLADRAIKLLPKGSPYAIRALDIKQVKDDDEDSDG